MRNLRTRIEATMVTLHGLATPISNRRLIVHSQHVPIRSNHARNIEAGRRSLSALRYGRRSLARRHPGNRVRHAPRRGLRRTVRGQFGLCCLPRARSPMRLGCRRWGRQSSFRRIPDFHVAFASLCARRKHQKHRYAAMSRSMFSPNCCQSQLMSAAAGLGTHTRAIASRAEVPVPQRAVHLPFKR